MKRRLDRNSTAVLVLLVVVHSINIWYGVQTWQERQDIEQLEEELTKEQGTVRRLRAIESLSALQQELATLQAKVPANSEQAIPSSVDTLQLVSDLTSIPPESGVRLINFKGKEPKTETTDGRSFQMLGYELSLHGNVNGLPAVLRRIDQSPLTSLRIPAMSLTRQDDGWTMRLDLSVHVLSPVQPTPTPAKPAPGPTPASKPR
ncbi:MAG: hypothetical protein HY675_26925 [Chloroflexi bacterium]|nr:hypothetical protein [Chloroflexota bacterium]